MESSAEVPEAPQSTWEAFVAKLKAAWHWFDVNVGGWLGLDQPKYEAYIDEHKRLLHEEDISVRVGSVRDQQVSRDLDHMEGGPPASVLAASGLATPSQQPPRQEILASDIRIGI